MTMGIGSGDSHAEDSEMALSAHAAARFAQQQLTKEEDFSEAVLVSALGDPGAER
jgi:hypothetical protein